MDPPETSVSMGRNFNLKLTSIVSIAPENSIFAIGQNTQEGSQGVKKKDLKTGEERLDTLDIKNEKKDAKKERDKYAVNLRKQRR